jgi:hypothetical protein
MPSVLKYLGYNNSNPSIAGKAVDYKTVETMPDDLIYSTVDSEFGRTWAVQNSKRKFMLNLVPYDSCKDFNYAKYFDLTIDPGENSNLVKSKHSEALDFQNLILAQDKQVGWASMPAADSGEPNRSGMDRLMFAAMGK